MRLSSESDRSPAVTARPSARSRPLPIVRELPMWSVRHLASALLVLLVLLPLFALLVTLAPADLLLGLREPAALEACLLSMRTTSMCLAVNVVCGTPLAWTLARRAGWWSRSVDMLLQLPIVIPPAVAGVGLLMAFGKRGLLGPAFEFAHIQVPFTSLAVVIAQMFVAAPLYVRGATLAFKSIDESILLVARTLGGSPARVFFKVAAPAAFPGLLAAGAVSWARSLGEFGATLMFAGNLGGRTQTLPLLIYEAMEGDVRVAQSISVVLLVVASVVLYVASRR